MVPVVVVKRERPVAILLRVRVLSRWEEPKVLDVFTPAFAVQVAVFEPVAFDHAGISSGGKLERDTDSNQKAQILFSQ